jgi:general secretion pathway protein N
MKRLLIWGGAAVLVMLLTMMACMPASWLGQIVENQTAGRLALGDPQGSVWQGSAFFGAATDGSAAITPLLPGRFSWRLSPLVLLGRVDALVQNQEALSAPLSVRGSWRQWRLGASSLLLPAERLTALGAPLNTMKPTGRMRLSWEELTLSRSHDGLAIDGRMQLEMMEIASALSPVKPLGAYRLQLDWHGARAQLSLATLSGPLLLNGDGAIAGGRLQFSGEAKAEEGQEERLAILLNLLGQKRRVGNKNIIALEFK